MHSRRIRIVLAIIVFSLGIGLSLYRTFQTNRGKDDRDEIAIAHWLLHIGMREAFQEAIDNYHQLKPKTRITQTPVPGRLYPAWVRTQLVGNTSPALTGILGLNEEQLTRYFLPLTPYLSESNPYNADTELADIPWRDTFLDGLNGVRNLTPSSGEITGVMLLVNSLRVFYNSDLLRKITGSVEISGNFADLQHLNERVAEYNSRTGRRIVLMVGCGPYAQYLFDILMSSQTQKLTLELSPSRNLQVSALDLAALFLERELSYAHTPELYSSLEIMQYAAQWLTPGFMALERDDAIGAYMRGEAVMIYAGSWLYANFKQNPALETRIIPLPQPRRSDAFFGKFTLGPASESAVSPEAMIGITRATKNREAALDFLHYLTSQVAASQFTLTSQRVSAIIGTPAPPDADSLGPLLEGELRGVTPDFLGFGAGHTFNFFQRNRHLALGPQGDVAKFARTLDEGIAAHLRSDLTAHLRHSKNEVRRSDARTALHYSLPATHPSRPRWTRHAEVQHTRQLETLHYRHYVLAP